MDKENKLIQSKSVLDAISNIIRVASAETNTLKDRALKLSEETGELSQAILSLSKTRGCEYKEKDLDDVNEEVVGVIVSCLATAVEANPGLNSLDLFLPIIDKQLNKWINASDLYIELEDDERSN